MHTLRPPPQRLLITVNHPNPKMLVGRVEAELGGPDRALAEKKHLEGRKLLVIYTISGKELPCHKLWSGESGPVNQISVRLGESLPVEEGLTVPS